MADLLQQEITLHMYYMLAPVFSGTGIRSEARIKTNESNKRFL